MYGKRFCVTALATFAFLAALTAASATALAEPPEPVVRHFALIVADDIPPAPDLTASGSQLLVTQGPSEPHAGITFINTSPAHAGQTWFFGGKVAHVTDRGVETYYLLWLDELPPSGTIAWTGPEGAAEFDTTPVFVRPAVTGEGDTGKFTVDLSPTKPGTAKVMYFGTGEFTK